MQRSFDHASQVEQTGIITVIDLKKHNVVWQKKLWMVFIIDHAPLLRLSPCRLRRIYKWMDDSVDKHAFTFSNQLTLEPLTKKRHNNFLVLALSLHCAAIRKPTFFFSALRLRVKAGGENCRKIIYGILELHYSHCCFSNHGHLSIYKPTKA